MIAGAVLSVAPLCVAGKPLSSLGHAAFELCVSVPDHPTEADRQIVESAYAASEHAVTTEPNNAVAHFALFCSLAKLTYLNGVSLKSLFAVLRMRREIDRTIALDPDYNDALMAKGAFLMELPRILGGDPREGERLLRDAVRRQPAQFEPRLRHADALQQLGAHDEAVEEARIALELARRGDRKDQEEDAIALLHKLGVGLEPTPIPDKPPVLGE